MKLSNIFSILVADLFFDLVIASPGRGEESNSVSPDATCGPKNGLSCLNSGFGDCCSKYNWW
jgi:hypothetical protein